MASVVELKTKKILIVAFLLVLATFTALILHQTVLKKKLEVLVLGHSVSMGMRESNIPPVYSFPSVSDGLRLNIEMSSLCQAVKDIPELVWIALEDTKNKTQVLEELLERCGLKSLELKSKTLPMELPSITFKRKTIFAITPTYKRLTQKVDLTSLCQTLMNVPDLIWIVVEDSEQKTDLVAALLKRCNVTSIHLKASVSRSYWPTGRGIAQCNYGLEWIRSYCNILSRIRPCQGVVYFMDDDNKYDLRLFEEIRKTKEISVFPIAFVGGLKVEGPICKDGRVAKWHTGSRSSREQFPIDMAAFALNVQLILNNPVAWMGYNPNGSKIGEGRLETSFLEKFVTNRTKLECRGNDKEVLAWHVKVQKPDLGEQKKTIFGQTNDVDLQY